MTGVQTCALPISADTGEFFYITIPFGNFIIANGPIHSDTFTDEEKQEIEDAWYDGGLGWLVDGEHDWLIDYESITIYGPYKVDKITYSDYNIVSEEQIELKPRPPLDPNKAWPF